ncbi:MAG: membrane protein insertase YidC [Chlamydiota bacterium]
MNFRFILFVILMTASFMLVNYWYGPARKAPTPETTQVIEPTSLTQNQPVSPQQLPLTSLYDQVDAAKPATSALAVTSGNYLALSWAEETPERAYVQQDNGTLKEIRRVVNSKEKGGLVFYSSQEKPVLDVVALPDVGAQPVQLVFFSEQGQPEIIAADYDDGNLLFNQPPLTQNAIVLFKVNGRYLPAGLYNSSTQTFAPLTNFPEYGAFARYFRSGVDANTTVDETFYVLENETIQVVFSAIGGAIAEVNLPFRSAKFPEAVVLPIQVDRSIVKSSPANALFPLHSYWAIDQATGQQVSKKPVEGGYYPLLRRGIAAAETASGYRVPARYYAFNTLSEDPDTANLKYRVRRFDKESIEFELSLPNRRVIKTYRLPTQEAPYCLLASVQVEGDARGLWISSGVPEVELISGSPAPALRYSRVQNQRLSIDKLSLPKTSTTLSSFQPNWVANSNGYFSLIFDPLTEMGMGVEATLVPGDANPTRLSVIDAQNNLYPASKYPGYQFLLPLKKSNTPTHFRLFLGPLDHAILKEVDAIYTDDVTGYNPNYSGARSFHGWFAFISEPFAKFLFMIMNFFHSLTHSWGLSIILLTIVLRIMMYPLNAWSIKSTLKLQEVGPKLQKLQAKYKNDPKRAQLEVMQFYREHKINPFGGCLPLIIQMPFLFGMFDLLKSTFSLRGATFIPGWIDNLTAPDLLFSWKTPIPFIGTGFHLLPIILGVVMFFQQKLSAAQNKKKGVLLTDQQKQQQKMGSIMTVAFTVLFYKFPSGLNLYWLSSMGLQILQQWYMMNRRKKASSSTNKEVVVQPKSRKTKS